MFKEADLAGKEAFDEVGRLSAARLMYQQHITQAEHAIEVNRKDMEVLVVKLTTAKQNLLATEGSIRALVKSLS